MSEKPAGNGSRDAWVTYAVDLGIEVLDSMSRDDLKDLVSEFEASHEPIDLVRTDSDLLRNSDNPVVVEVTTDFDNIQAVSEDDSPEAEGDVQVDGSVISIRFIETGLSGLSNVWRAGQELTVAIDSADYARTMDRNGNSWLDLAGNPEAQIKRWGKVFFEEI